MQVHVNIRELIGKKTSVLADLTMTEKEKFVFILAVSERMQELLRRYCPYHFGNLRNSLEVEETSTGFIFVYSASYAPYVHEIMYRKHKRPTRPKWTIEALRQALKELILEFGNENIPSFNIVFQAFPTLSLEITTDTTKGLNWREFV